MSKSNTLESAHHNLIDRLNNGMDQSDTEITKAKYLDSEDLAPLLNDKSLSLPLFHSDISS